VHICTIDDITNSYHCGDGALRRQPSTHPLHSAGVTNACMHACGQYHDLWPIREPKLLVLSPERCQELTPTVTNSSCGPSVPKRQPGASPGLSHAAPEQSPDRQGAIRAAPRLGGLEARRLKVALERLAATITRRLLGLDTPRDTKQVRTGQPLPLTTKACCGCRTYHFHLRRQPACPRQSKSR
jgi:hypothetical protein